MKKKILSVLAEAGYIVFIIIFAQFLEASNGETLILAFLAQVLFRLNKLLDHKKRESELEDIA